MAKLSILDDTIKENCIITVVVIKNCVFVIKIMRKQMVEKSYLTTPFCCLMCSLIHTSSLK